MSSFDQKEDKGILLENLLDAFKKSMARASQSTAREALENPAMLYGKRAIYGVQDLRVTLKASFSVPTSSEGETGDKVVIDLSPQTEVTGELSFTVTGRMNETPENRPAVFIAAEEVREWQTAPIPQVPDRVREFRSTFICLDENGLPIPNTDLRVLFTVPGGSDSAKEIVRPIRTDATGTGSYTLYWDTRPGRQIFYLPPAYKQRNVNKLLGSNLLVRAKGTLPNSKTEIRERSPFEITPKLKD